MLSAVGISALLLIYHNNLAPRQANKISQSADQQEVRGQAIDTADWKTYKDSQYDFEIKYPDSWDDPRPQTISNSDFDYQYKVSFGTVYSLKGKDNKGFSIFVSKKNTSNENADNGDCISSQTPDSSDSNSSGQTAADKDRCLLHKLKVPGVDPDYYSYQFAGENFEYNILPTLILDSRSSQLATDSIPELEAAAKTFSLDFETIQKKTAARLKQQFAAAIMARINAEYYPPSQGTPVCPDLHDRPSYSAKDKNKHIDEDCCPDPDEWPNLRCKYKSSDYNIMLKGSPLRKLLR